MRRREFITAFAGAAVTWPVMARAQQSAMPVIGFLSSEAPERSASRLRAFHQGLSETGLVEGGNVKIEYRWAEGQNDRLPVLATDLVRRQVGVIVVAGTPPALAAKAATATIPIVFVTAADPVAVELVASLNRPGGNITGVASLGVEVGPKQLELLRELIPSATDMALLANPANPALTRTLARDLNATAQQAERSRRIGVLMNLVEENPEAISRRVAFQQAFHQTSPSRICGRA